MECGGNAIWKDQLTAIAYRDKNGITHNGTFSYDAVGNPLTYNNGKNSYTTLGGKIVREAYGANVVDYFYDNNGSPYKIVVKAGSANPVTGYFVLNLQGDVIGIIDGDGMVAVEYQYDAWGKEISHTTAGNSGSTLYNHNALKYRGYYYDSDLGLYYLNNRFYDQEIGRFINADTIELVLASQTTLTDKNLYAYCDNNPIVRVDSTGAVWETVFDLVSLGFSIAEVAANPYDVGTWIGLVGDAIDLIPIVTGIGETVRGVRLVDKAGNTFEIAKAVDFTDDTKKTINLLDNVNGFTKSTREDGIKIHTGYKKGNGFLEDNKEYTKVAGIRSDYYDGITIFELKPYNPRVAKAGVKQLKKYNSVLGGGKVMRMEFY